MTHSLGRDSGDDSLVIREELPGYLSLLRGRRRQAIDGCSYTARSTSATEQPACAKQSVCQVKLARFSRYESCPAKVSRPE